MTISEDRAFVIEMVKRPELSPSDVGRCGGFQGAEAVRLLAGPQVGQPAQLKAGSQGSRILLSGQPRSSSLPPVTGSVSQNSQHWAVFGPVTGKGGFGLATAAPLLGLRNGHLSGGLRERGSARLFPGVPHCLSR